MKHWGWLLFWLVMLGVHIRGYYLTNHACSIFGMCTASYMIGFTLGQCVVESLLKSHLKFISELLQQRDESENE